jgi:hypothetical protein
VLALRPGTILALDTKHRPSYNPVAAGPFTLSRQLMSRLSIVVAALLLAVLSAARAQDKDKDAFGPATDRVGLPKYTTGYTMLRTFSTPQDKVITVFANERAASLTDLAALPYPYGSIIVFERRNPLKDAAGATLRDDKGQVRGGDIFQIDVMRREKGFGESYRDVRTGEWEFASYRPDGTFLTPPDRTSTCATCHMKAAARDFVFRGRFPALPGQ